MSQSIISKFLHIGTSSASASVPVITSDQYTAAQLQQRAQICHANAVAKGKNQFVNQATPPCAAEDQAAADAAAREAAAAQKAAAEQAASSAPKPACLPLDLYNLAQTLCAQKRIAGQEAVAAFGRTLGSADAAYIAISPCDWARVPLCPSAPAPKTTKAPASSAPPSSVKLEPPPPRPVVAAQKNDTLLIVGGVALGAIVLGGVYYAVKRRG